jgi:hypothetical protein
MGFVDQIFTNVYLFDLIMLRQVAIYSKKVLRKHHDNSSTVKGQTSYFVMVKEESSTRTLRMRRDRQMWRHLASRKGWLAMWQRV